MKLLLNKILYKVQYLTEKDCNDLTPAFYLVKRPWVWFSISIFVVIFRLLKQLIIIPLEYYLEVSEFKVVGIEVKEGVDPKTIDSKTKLYIRKNLM